MGITWGLPEKDETFTDEVSLCEYLNGTVLPLWEYLEFGIGEMAKIMKTVSMMKNHVI